MNVKNIKTYKCSKRFATVISYLVLFFICCCNFSDFDSATISNGSANTNGSGAVSNIFSGISSMQTGYVEIDVTFSGGVEVDESYYIVLRFVNDSNFYSCGLGDLAATTPGDKIDVMVGGVVSDNAFLSGNLPTSFDVTYSNSIKLGCEITSDGYLKSYINRVLMSSYKIGTDPLDTALTSGRVGMLLVDQNATTISVDNFKFYKKFGF